MNVDGRRRSEVRSPGRFYAAVLATALVLLTSSFIALIVVGAMRNTAATGVSAAAFAQDRLNYVVYSATNYDSGNERSVQDLRTGMTDLDHAILLLEDRLHTDKAEHTVVVSAAKQLAQWTARLDEATTPMEIDRAATGVTTASDRMSDAIQQDVIMVTRELARLQTVFALLVPFTAVTILGSLYLVVLLYLSIRATLRWNHDVLESLASGAEDMPMVAIPAARVFPGARALVEQSAAIGGELSHRVQDERAMAERTDKLSRELSTTVEELVASRSEYQRSAQLAAVGKVAGAVSHEINNPVTGVLGYLAFIRKRSTNDEVIKYTDKAYVEVQRIGRIAKSLLVFSRHNTAGRPAPFDIETAVANVVTLVDIQMKEAAVELALEPVVDLPPVIGQVSEFQQVLLNLLLNARDAVKTGEDRRVFVSVEGLEKSVTVKVTDTGPGVPLEVRSRLFEPFFTTKSAGEGSGLGLSVATELMERMGGSVALDPDHRPGAQFVVTLPTAAAAMSAAKPDLAGGQTRSPQAVPM